MELHHVGYLVKDIEKTTKEMSLMGLAEETSEVFYDEEQDAYVKFLGNSKDEKKYIELVQPGENNSSLLSLLNKKGDHMYHICNLVANIEESINKLTSKGAILIKPPKCAKAFDGRRVAFLFIRQGLLLELLEC